MIPTFRVAAGLLLCGAALLAVTALLRADDGADKKADNKGAPKRGFQGKGNFGKGDFSKFAGAFQKPGQILSKGYQERLELTADQKKELEKLQSEVDAKLAKILDETQRKTLKDSQERFGQFRRPGAPGSGDRPKFERKKPETKNETE